MEKRHRQEARLTAPAAVDPPSHRKVTVSLTIHPLVSLLLTSVICVVGFTSYIMYAIVYNQAFLRSLPSAIQDGWFLVRTVAVFLLVWLAVRIFGQFVTHVIHPSLQALQTLAEVIRTFIEAFGQSKRNRVLHASDTFVYAIDAQDRPAFHQVSQQRTTYNYKGELSSSHEVPALPPARIPTGRELLLNGTVETALQNGAIVLGVTSEGEVKYLKIKKCFSMLVSGIPAVGKTTTVFWIVAQLAIVGAKFFVVDPHLNFQDEDGNKSLAAELADLADSFQFAPCDAEPSQVIARVQWMYEQLRHRQQAGYVVRAENTVIGIIDEFNSIADSIDPKRPLVTHENRPLNFGQTLALLEREGRKYGLHFMLIGHKWARQDIGGDNAVRTNAASYLCHKLNDEQQATLLLGSKLGKLILTLTTGEYIVTGSSWNAEPTKLTTPNVSAIDIPAFLQIKRRGVEVVKMENFVDAPLSVVSEVVADERAAPVSNEPSGSHGGYTSGSSRTPLVEPMDTTKGEMSLPLTHEQKRKMLQVLKMDAQGTKGQNEIISTVWGVDANTRAGRAAAEELRVIRAAVAEETRKRLGI